MILLSNTWMHEMFDTSMVKDVSFIMRMHEKLAFLNKHHFSSPLLSSILLIKKNLMRAVIERSCYNHTWINVNTMQKKGRQIVDVFWKMPNNQSQDTISFKFYLLNRIQMICEGQRYDLQFMIHLEHDLISSHLVCQLNVH